MKNLRPQKLNYMFLRPFFSEKDAGGRLFIFIFLPFANKNNVQTMFHKNFRLLISGAESRERVYQNSATNQQYLLVNKYNCRCEASRGKPHAQKMSEGHSARGSQHIYK